MAFIDEFRNLENKVLANIILDKSVSWLPVVQKLPMYNRRLLATGTLFVNFFVIELILLYVTRTPVLRSLRSSLLSALVASLSLYVVSLGYHYILTRLTQSSVRARVGKNVDKLLTKWILEISGLFAQIITSVILAILAIISVYITGSMVGVPFRLDIPTYFALGLITFCMGQGAYWNAVIPLVTRKLRQLNISEFGIFTLNPSKSPFIVSISRTYSIFVAIDALVVTFCLLGVFFLYPQPTSARSLYYIGLVLLGYVLTSYTFFYPQWNLARIIQAAKDVAIHELQQKIAKQYSHILNSEEVDIEHFNHLMALLEKVEKTPNSAIRLSGIQSFIGSLALPTIAAIIGALDWKAIFNRLFF